jgi:hypothetical protein
LRSPGSPSPDERSASHQLEVRAEVIAEILLSESAPTKRARLVLSGARITGSLDLSSAHIEHPITFRDCVFDQPIVLAEARLGALTLDGCAFPGIDAPNLEVDGDLGLSGVSSSRAVRLTGALLHRDIRLNGAHLRHGEDQDAALDADYLVVNGSVVGPGCEASGTVTMAGARVSGSVRLDGATIAADGKQTVAYYGDGMTVGLEFNAQGLSAKGEVRLVDVAIASTLELRGARLSNAGRVALRLDRAEISSSFYCDNGFTAVGEVCAIGARVKGSVYLNNSEVGTPTPSAGATRSADFVLRLVRIRIDGDFGCWEGFVAHGPIDLARSSVGGEFRLVTTGLKGYPKAADLTNCQFGSVTLSGEPPAGFVDFTDARADFFRDSVAYWQSGDIVLDGFEYQKIQMTWVTVKQREQWLTRAMEASRRKPGSTHDGHLPQPYNQLAEAYRRGGQERDAEKILMASEKARYRTSRPWHLRMGGRIYGLTLGYGYRLSRAFLLLPILYLITVLVVNVTQDHNAFIAVRAPRSTVTATHCTSMYPCLSKWAYPVDWIVPIIDLHQSEYWQPDAHSTIGHAARDWLYATTVLGWAATTLLVGAFAGLARKLNR